MLFRSHPGTPTLHVGKPARGVGLFMPVEYTIPQELVDEEFPLIMTTGRILYHYHTRSMTSKTEGINWIAPDNYVEISPNLAAALDVKDGEVIKVSSRRGSVNVAALITDIVEDNVVFMPFHWADGANVLTNGEVLDKYSKIPGLKVTGVKIEKTEF